MIKSARREKKPATVKGLLSPGRQPATSATSAAAPRGHRQPPLLPRRSARCHRRCLHRHRLNIAPPPIIHFNYYLLPVRYNRPRFLLTNPSPPPSTSTSTSTSSTSITGGLTGGLSRLLFFLIHPSLPLPNQRLQKKKNKKYWNNFRIFFLLSLTGVTGNWMEAAIRWKFKQKPSGIKLLLLCHGRQVFRRSGAVVVNCSLTFITPDRAARSHQQLWMQKKHEEMRAMCYYRRLFSPNEIQWINRSGLGNPFLARRIEIDVIQC